MNQVGILVHGRHVEAVDWEKLMWGCPPERYGSLTRLVLEILMQNPKNIKQIVFGSGASERDGVKEAECMKRYLIENMSRIDEFPEIAKHLAIMDQVSALIKNIHCDVVSQNTAEEIENAATKFAEASCTRIFEITCASHASRCTALMNFMVEKGTIPSDQFWYTVSDRMTYAGSTMNDVVVFEPPHIPRDRRLSIKQPAEVFRQIFQVPPEKRGDYLEEADRLLKRHIGSS